MTGADLVAEARTWLGTPWRHQGRNRDGVDCAGLVLKVAHALGLTQFDTADYTRQANDESMLGLCREHLMPVMQSDLQPGDVIVLRYGKNRHIGFVGDYAHGGLTIIHAQTASPRRVVENQFTEAWLRAMKGSLIGCFRFPGVAP